MILNKDNTKVIFVMTSSSKPLEDRFVDDFKNAGLKTLKKLGLQEEQITVVSDTSKDELIARHCLSDCLVFKDSSDLLSCIESIDCENLLVVSSCHGSIDGFDSKTKIQPFPFISAINKNPHTNNVLVMLGQCFSGIFNYMPLDPHKNIVLMGAAGMNESASAKGTIEGKTITWLANIAVYSFFEWLSNPKDIDGDNKTTAMDLYKYVVSFVLKSNDLLEHKSFATWMDQHKQYDEKVEKTDKSDTTALLSLKSELLKINWEYLLPRQLPWIHNIEGALAMTIEY